MVAAETPQGNAVDVAALLETGACREYVAMHRHVGLHPGERVLDVACGSGLALELACLHDVVAAGIDASPRLVEIARLRLPQADLRVGDVAALPWEDGSFGVVTSFRGLWAGTASALVEARRVLRPGGRLAVTAWGDVRKSPGNWALSPFTLAAPHEVLAQAEPTALGRPGVGERILAEAGFVRVRRHRVPFVWEFPDPEAFARMLSSTGPGYEAVQAVGEDEFRRCCVEVARERLRAGLPLRAEIDGVGFTAHAPAGPCLREAPPSAAGETLAAEDLEELGFVTSIARLWAHGPAAFSAMFDLIGSSAQGAGLSMAERGVATIVAAGRSGDGYCPLAWGDKLGGETTPETAAAVILGSADRLDERSRAVARWAARVADDPHAAAPADIARLRSVGFDDDQILQLTLFLALRIAFATVNGALGARPEQEYVDAVHPTVARAWLAAFGEPVDPSLPSTPGMAPAMPRLGRI